MKTFGMQFGYYLLQIMQRLSVLFTDMYTMIYWIVFLITVVLIEYSIQTVNHAFTNRDAAQHAITVTVNILALQAIIAGAVATATTLVMLLVPSVRKNEKRLVMDSMVFAIFCVVSVLVSQFAVRYFIERYLVGI